MNMNPSDVSNSRNAKMTSRRRNKNIKQALRVPIRFSTILLVLFLSVTIIQVVSLRFINPPFTMKLVWDYVNHFIGSDPYHRPRFTWRPLERISPHLRRAVLAAEDQRLLHHHGFDMVEIRKAAKDTLMDQRTRGASTISMQTARTVYLLPERSIFRKALEAYYTALVEMLWNKRRILEVYLNTVDWGTGIMGAEAASMVYFQKHSDGLSSRQSALLAAILPNPHRLSPVEPNNYVRMRVRRILADMTLMPLL